MVVGSIGFTIRASPVPPLHERWEFWVVLFSAVGALVGQIATAKRSHRVTDLLAERDELKSSLLRIQSLEEEVQQKYNDLSALHLAGLMHRMGLDGNDRVSIYKHNENSFYRIARHSSNPIHARPGRSIYPHNEGCMGEALQEGIAFEENLPANSTSYETRLMQRWQMQQETIRNLTMRSRSLAAFALHRPVGGRRFAIIVFESMATGRIDARCRARFDQEEQGGIIQWLETMERFEPKPSEAKQEGF